MAYTDQVLDHFRNPRHAGELASATAIAEVSNPVCGDVVKIWLVLEGETIAAATFKAEGCVPAVACASWLVERIRGMRLAEVASVSPEDVASGLGGLPPASAHAARLAVDACRKATERAGQQLEVRAVPVREESV